MSLTSALFLALLATATTPTSTPPLPASPPDPTVAPPDNLAVQGAPSLSARVAAAVQRYSEARGATFTSWDPARREMVIRTRFADTVQLHRVAAPRGDRTQLTFFPDRVGNAAFPRAVTPGPRYLVFEKDQGGNERSQLHRLDLDGSQTSTLLTDGSSRNNLGPFAHRSDRLAYTSTRRNGADSDIYVLDARASKGAPNADRLVAEVKGGGWSVEDWSPDDSKLLLREMISVNESVLWSLELGTGQKTLLTPRTTGEPVAYGAARFAADGRAVFLTTDRDDEHLRLARLDLATGKLAIWSSAIPWDIEELELSADGRRLAAVANEDGVGRLHLYDARTGKEQPAPALPAGSVLGVGWHAQGDLAVTMGQARMAADVFVVAGRTNAVTRWTESELGPVALGDLPEPELVKWKTFDERTLSGLLYLPPARFTGPRPVLINIHGGPEGQSRPAFQGRNNYLLAELGVALLYPNVRGSTGYGKSFTKLDNGPKREDSVKDVSALLDWLGTRPELDAQRVMVMGGSYGGYMSLAVSIREAARLRGAIDIVGISHFVTFLERTEAYRRDLRRVEYGDERDPAMRKLLDGISPLTNAARITRPLLVAQGLNDPRVPANEAEQIVASLRKRDVPVWYLLARDEGHGFAKKRNADFLFGTIVSFIERYLLEIPR